MKKYTRSIYPLISLCMISGGLALGWGMPQGWAQNTDENPSAESEASPSPSSEAASSTSTVALPNPLPAIPNLEPGDQNEYVLEFNRSPIVGNRLRLESIYDEARLQFTRPRNWKPEAVKVLLRYRHSPALYASRSNLTVLINGTSIGSVPLNQAEGKIGSAVFNVPPGVLQDYNEVSIAALQNNSPTCTQDPYDPSLWTEIMPDSKIVFDFQPQSIPLNFNRFPYPIFDTLSLETNQLAYLLPNTLDQTWLTSSARFQATMGRIADFRNLDTRLVEDLDQVKETDRLIVIGTPKTQPALKSLDLPLAIQGDQVLDGKKQPIPSDVGVLMLATTAADRVPVLIATGNSEAAVAKAVQFLVQSGDRRIGTGNVIFVDQLPSVPSPPLRNWPRYLPETDQFQLSDLKDYNNQPYEDVSVRGSHAPALEFDFRALPDDQVLPGTSMNLSFSYGPQVNPLTSLVEVQLDGVPLGGKRLTSVAGSNRDSVQIDLPQERIKPNSKMQINFRLDPREQRSCSRVTDQQLWGTVHVDTRFNLKRDQVARVPSLKLLQFGYPFAAPQDLVRTALVLPNKPDRNELALMLETSERLGRLSRSESVQLQVYRADDLPEDQRKAAHLIGIGTQADFPFPELFEANGFALQRLFSREWQDSRIQTLPDGEGVVKEIVSPWNGERVLLGLTAQTSTGLNQVRDLMERDPLFYQLDGDTVLISANQADPSPYSDQDYSLEVLQQSPQREVSSAPLPNQVQRLLRSNWLVLAPGLVAAALILYGITQLYLKKLTGQER